MPRCMVDMSPSHELSRSKENVRRYPKLFDMQLKRRRNCLRFEELETSGTADAMLHAIAVESSNSRIDDAGMP